MTLEISSGELYSLGSAGGVCGGRTAEGLPLLLLLLLLLVTIFDVVPFHWALSLAT